MKSGFALIAVVGILVVAVLFGGSAIINTTKPREDTVSREQMNDWMNTAAWYESQAKQLEQDKAAMAEKQHALEMQLQSERASNQTTLALLAQGQGNNTVWLVVAGVVLLVGGGLAVAMYRRQSPQAQPQPIIIQLPQQAQYAQLSDGRIEAIEAEVAQIRGGITQVVGYIEAQRAERVQVQAPQGKRLQVTQTKERGRIVGPR